MKYFLGNLVKYVIILSGFLIIIMFNNGFQPNNLSLYDNPKYYTFEKKKLLFSEFFYEKPNINLILGSSVIRDSIIPDSLGENWFSFSNGAQNIYNSYKFLNYYKDSVKIDTILISINPFDFFLSYKDDYNITNNLLFHKFGEDSILFFDRKEFYYQRIQNIIDKELFSLEKFFKNNNSPKINLTKQGGRGDCVSGINLDSSIIYQSLSNSVSHLYYRNIIDKPNLKFFLMFHELCNKLGVKVFYILPPKSKIYLNAFINSNYHLIWYPILETLKTYDLIILNYEKFDIKEFDFYFFSDEVHLSCKAARVFTKIIKADILN